MKTRPVAAGAVGPGDQVQTPHGFLPVLRREQYRARVLLVLDADPERRLSPGPLPVRLRCGIADVLAVAERPTEVARRRERRAS